MLGAEGELGDVVHGAVLLYDQDVVLPGRVWYGIDEDLT